MKKSLKSNYYLPHPSVIKESSSTTKTRVVFDASARTDRGISLNEALLTGPIIQAKLFSHLLRFRLHKYVITADITQMYRQVWVHPDDRKFLRIFWIRDGKLRVYQLNTVTFGLTSASFLAIRTLHQLAQDEKEKFPLGASALISDFYVDDFISGSDTLDGLEQLRDQVTKILACGGFQLRKWASNNPRVLQGLKVKTEVEFLIEEGAIHKTLGLSWHAKNDEFLFCLNAYIDREKITMRDILSGIARIYDPMGFLEPIVLDCKWIMQQCWLRKLAWDELVPSDIREAWILFVDQLNLLSNLKIPRYAFVSDFRDLQLRGFCDASQKSYGACLYVRCEKADGVVQV